MSFFAINLSSEALKHTKLYIFIPIVYILKVFTEGFVQI